MAELNVSGRMKVKTLRDNFYNEFGLTLRVYDGVKFADDDATLASIRKHNDNKSGELKIHGRMLVGNFENSFKETFGVKIQVANEEDTKLVDNSLSLTQASKQ